MSTFTSMGAALLNAYEARIKSLLPSVPMLYRGVQGSDSDYIHIVDDDESYASEWSDKDSDGNDSVVVLQLWGSMPRTLSGYAKTIIDSVNQTPLTVAGFYHLRTVVEQNRGLPALTIEGQANQFSRLLQIRFFYHPN